MRYIVREKFFHLGEDSAITDEHGRPLYIADGKVFSIRNTVVIRDLRGNELATIKRQLLALALTYHITRHGQDEAVIRKKIFSPFIQRYTVDIPGPDDLEVTGSLLEHNFTITRHGQTAAVVSKRWASLTETYGVEIAPGEDDILILATVIAMDLAEDQEERNRESAE